VTVLRQAVAPVAAAYLFLLVVIWYGVRHPVPRPGRSAPVTRRTIVPLLRYIGSLALGGYVTLLAIVLVFGVLIVRADRSMVGAASAGLFLLAMAVPVFVLLTWVDARRTGRG
jgi:hypothetical protein